MLDAIHPWGRKVPPYASRAVWAQVAVEPWQRQEHFRLREQIFSREQGLFAGSDRDEHDDTGLPIVALCSIFGVDHEVVGVVRIYPTGDGTWYGGRLGVAASHRRVGTIGTALITCAVSTAHARGCQTFLATVQEQNVKYFERHDFYPKKIVQVQGKPHCLMEARLDSYPPELSRGPVLASKTGVVKAGMRRSAA